MVRQERGPRIGTRYTAHHVIGIARMKESNHPPGRLCGPPHVPLAIAMLGAGLMAAAQGAQAELFVTSDYTQDGGTFRNVADSNTSLIIAGPTTPILTLTNGANTRGILDVYIGGEVEVFENWHGGGRLLVEEDSVFNSEGYLFVGNYHGRNDTGSLEIRSGGVVRSGDGWIGNDSFDYPGAVTVNGNGSRWDSHGDINIYRGGTLNIENGGVVTSTGSSVDYAIITGNGSAWHSSSGEFLVNGALRIEHGGTLDSVNSFVAAYGTITVTGSGSTWHAGELDMATYGEYYYDDDYYSEFGGTLSIEDGGALYSEKVYMGPGTVSVTGDGSAWYNSGTLFVSKTLSVDHGGVVYADHLHVGNTLKIENGGAVRADRIYIDEYGTVSGNGGTLEGTVEVHGTLAPGESPGSLDIVGDLELESDGRLVIELGGTAPNTYDVVNVTGTASLAGTLEIRLVDGFLPRAGESFDFLTAGLFTGAFETFVLPSLIDRTFEFSFSPDGFTATVTPVPLPATLPLLLSALGGLGWRRRGQNISG